MAAIPKVNMKFAKDLKVGDRYYKYSPSGKVRTIATVTSQFFSHGRVEIMVTLLSRGDNKYCYTYEPEELFVLAQ